MPAACRHTDAMQFYIRRLEWGLPGAVTDPILLAMAEDMFDGTISGCDTMRMAYVKDLMGCTRFAFRDGSYIDMDPCGRWWRIDDRRKMQAGVEYAYQHDTDTIEQVVRTLADPPEAEAPRHGGPLDAD